MMMSDCNIVRDLTPLVLDRAASDESRLMVEKHIASCASCKEQYESMKAEMPADARTEYEEEQRRFVQAAKDVRKKRLKRWIIAITLTVVLCAGAALGGMFAYDAFYNRASVQVDNNLYSLSLVRRKNRDIVVIAEERMNHNHILISEYYEQLNGKVIMYVYFSTPPAHSDVPIMNKSTKNICFIMKKVNENDYDEIRQGTPNDYVTIWRPGQQIPDASEEMELYYALEEQQYELLEASPVTSDGKGLFKDPEEYNALWKAAQQVYQSIPELH